MVRDPSFPPPLSELGKSGIEIAATPTGGMGLALDEKGLLPAGVLFTDLARRMQIGLGTVTWPGGAVRSNALVVPHTLGLVPAAVLATMNSGLSAGTGLFPVIVTFSYTAAQFQAAADTSDGSLPAVGVTASFCWLAIA